MPSGAYVDNIFTAIQNKLPINFDPRDQTHKPSRDFLKDERIRGMWQSSYSVKEAVDLFMNSPVREVVAALVLTGLDDEQIAELMTRYKAVNVIGTSISEFRHYFWNTSLLSIEEWAEYLREPSIQPIHLTALRSPRNMDGVRVTLYKMGIMPKELDKKTVFTSVRDIGYMNFLESNGFPQSRHKAEMMGQYAGVITQAQRQLDEYEMGEQDVISEFYKRLTVGSREVKHKTLNELTGEGNGEGPIRELPSGGDG